MKKCVENDRINTLVPRAANSSLTIYSQPGQPKTFDVNDNEVIDEVMDIRLPAQKIFGKS
jgi:hypothetical protein